LGKPPPVIDASELQKDPEVWVFWAFWTCLILITLIKYDNKVKLCFIGMWWKWTQRGLRISQNMYLLVLSYVISL
jgi:hypothetical protein